MSTETPRVPVIKVDQLKARHYTLFQKATQGHRRNTSVLEVQCSVDAQANSCAIDEA